MIARALSRCLASATVVLAPVLMAGTRAASAATWSDSLATVVRSGRVGVDVLTLQLPARAQELSRKLLAAFQSDPQWAASYFKQHATERPLPWSPRFGLTQAEYAEYLRVSQQMKLVPVAQDTIVFERDAPGRRWTLHARGVLLPLDGLVLDLAHDAARSRDLSGAGQPITLGEPGVPMPYAWKKRWHAVSSDPDYESGRMFDLSIGPLRGQPAGALTYEVIVRDHGRNVRHDLLAIRWPLR